MFIMNDLHTAFEEDALASSHALSVPQGDIQKTYEIIEMFDTITYSKVESQWICTTVQGATHNHSPGINIKEFRFLH